MTDSWRVGILFSRTGVTSIAEGAQANAVELAIEQINASGGILGRPIEATSYDPASSPRLFKSCAEQLLIDDGVDVIFGCYMSSERKAVLPVVEALKKLLFYPTFYEGFEYSPYCIYTGATPAQSTLPLAHYLFGLGKRSYFLLGSNYVFPYESNRVMADLIVQEKRKVVDECYLPLECAAAEMDRAIRLIIRHKPDVIFSTLVGNSIPLFYERLAAADISSSETTVASLVLGESYLEGMPGGLAAGTIIPAPFFETIDTPAARSFSAAYRERFGSDRHIDAAGEAAYSQVLLYAKALELAGSSATEAVRASIRGLEVDAPQGRIRVDPDNNHTELWSRIGRVTPDNRIETVIEATQRVRPDPYWAETDFNGWSGQLQRIESI